MKDKVLQLFDPDRAKVFLLALVLGVLTDWWLEFRFLHPTHPPIQRFTRSLATIPWAEVRKLNAEGYAVTIGVGLRKSKGGKKDDVAAIPALWADIDFKHFAGGQEQALAKLNALPPDLAPSALIHSGHGLHLYWFLKDPVPVTDNNRSQLEGVLKGLQQLVESDAVHNVDRVMRLPGSVNVKDPNDPRPCSIVELHPDRRFTLEQFVALAKPVAVNAAALEDIEFASQLPTINFKDLRISGKMKSLVRIGWHKGGSYPTRSEAQQAVITAMREAEHSPTEIKAVFAKAAWKIGERYRQRVDEKGAQEADRELAASIAHADAFLAAAKAAASQVGVDILFQPNAAPPDIATLKAVVTAAFPELWIAVIGAMSTLAAMLLSDVCNPPTLVLEGVSSDGKTSVLDMLDRTPWLAHRSDNFTVAAFVSQAANLSEEELCKIDLLPRIQYRCMITAELAPLFRGREDELTKRFAILTAVLDGRGLKSDSGSHGSRGYEGDYLFSWLGATTPLPDHTWHVMQQLGGRLLFFWVNTTPPDISAIAKSLTGPKSYRENLEHCRQAVNDFLLALFREHATPEGERPFGVEWNGAADGDVVAVIAGLADMTATARAVVSLKYGWDDEPNFVSVSKENPWRLAALLFNLGRGHALLHGRTALTPDDLPIVARVALDTMPTERRKILRLLLSTHGKTCLYASDVEQWLHCSRPTALRLMRLMAHLQVGVLDEEDVSASSGPLTALRLWLHPDLHWLTECDAVMAIVSEWVTTPIEHDHSGLIE